MPTRAPKHRARPRARGRVPAVAASVGVLVVSGLAGTGVLPLSDTGSSADAIANANANAMVPRLDPGGESHPRRGRPGRPVQEPVVAVDRSEAPANRPTSHPTSRRAKHPTERHLLPPGFGSGRRVVYDISTQQVWLVRADEEVARSYLVSGSRFDQVDPGTYPVFSTSRHAISWHGTETMEYMVRFTRGDNANIGFHDIPVRTATGRAVQSLARLGTPLSDGCIRQRERDARALWEFAPLGTPVVVTA